MKVIFLDIDGVLNSVKYDGERGDGGNIDKSRLPLLKRAVNATGARIVLSSSWRRHWDKDQSKMTAEGAELVKLMCGYGLTIYDKTPDTGRVYGRKDEINNWLKSHPDVENFVILDDLPFGWGEFADRLVRTDARIGRGLGESHVQKNNRYFKRLTINLKRRLSGRLFIFAKNRRLSAKTRDIRNFVKNCIILRKLHSFCIAFLLIVLYNYYNPNSDKFLFWQMVKWTS